MATAIPNTSGATHYPQEVIFAMDCFRGPRPQSIIVKKLVVMDHLNENRYQVFLFKSPYYYSDNNSETRQAIDFATKYIHGLEWNSGFIEYYKLRDILRYYAEGKDTIYCKGKLNCQFVSGLLEDRLVTDIDDICEKYIKKRVLDHTMKNDLIGETRCLLIDHRRRHFKPGYESEEYTCALARARLWFGLIRHYKAIVFGYDSVDLARHPRYVRI